MGRQGRPRRRPGKVVLAVLIVLGSLAASFVAFADTIIVADGDSVSGVQTQMNLGTVCPGDTGVTDTAKLVLQHNSSSSSQWWANSAVVSITPGTPSDTQLTAAAVSSITLPSNWTSLDTSPPTLSDTTNAGVTLDVSSTATPGAKSATIDYTASGPKNGGGTLGNKVATLTVNWTVDTVANCAPADTTPPVISYVLNPASPDGANGWYTSDVTLTWTVTENESPGSLVKTGCVDQNITTDQQETTYSCSATSDGGSATQVDVKIKRDATLPTVSLVGGPQDGQSYYFGSVPAAPTCSASDATSGLDGACSVSGYGTTVGSHTVTADAKDMAGNTNSDSATYDVLAWTLNGFYQPVDMGDVWNTVKNGSTVPLKFNVFAGSTELTDVSVVSSFTVSPTTCPGSTATSDAVEFTTTGGTTLRYDTTGEQFVQNWQTPKKPGNCYRVTMTTLDGSSLSANFKLK